MFCGVCSCYGTSRLGTVLNLNLDGRNSPSFTAHSSDDHTYSSHLTIQSISPFKTCQEMAGQSAIIPATRVRPLPINFVSSFSTGRGKTSIERYSRGPYIFSRLFQSSEVGFLLSTSRIKYSFAERRPPYPRNTGMTEPLEMICLIEIYSSVDIHVVDSTK